MHRRIALALLAAATACAAPEAAGPARTPAPAPSAGPPVQAEAQQLVQSGIRGAVTYVRNGEQVWQSAAGTADGTTPLRTSHRFRIASITKTFTASLVLQQAAAGRLALTDRVDKLLPGVIKTDATVTDLLSHTSGITDYLTDERFGAALERGEHVKPWPPQKLLKYADKSGGQGYSNTNYILLGMILEKVTRQPYRELVRERITGPLALNATELPADLRPKGLAEGEHGDSGGTTEIDASVFWSAGGLVSTAEDVASFYRSVFSSPDGRKLAAGNFGIFTERLGCGRTVLTHSGMVYGYSGAAMASEDGKRVVVVQVNSTRPGDAIAAAGRLMCAL